MVRKHEVESVILKKMGSSAALPPTAPPALTTAPPGFYRRPPLQLSRFADTAPVLAAVGFPQGFFSPPPSSQPPPAAKSPTTPARLRAPAGRVRRRPGRELLQVSSAAIRAASSCRSRPPPSGPRDPADPGRRRHGRAIPEAPSNANTAAPTPTAAGRDLPLLPTAMGVQALQPS
nr:classical arabinogalactan protein 9-like [Lolium perenne]